MKGTGYFKSIQWKLVIIYILLIIVSMQIIGIYFIRSLEKYYLDNFNETLNTQAGLLVVHLERYLTDDELKENEKRAEIDYLVDHLFALNEVDISIIDSNGVVISSSEKEQPSIVGRKISQTEVNRALLGTRDEAIRVDANTGHRMKYLAIPIKQENSVLGVIFMRASIEGVYAIIYKINKILLTATVIALLFTAFLGYILSRTITKPIKEITRQASRLTMGDFDQKVPIYGDDEIGKLGLTFNNMAQKLKEAIFQIEEEKEKLSLILTHMSDGVLATNGAGKIVVANQRGLEIIELAEDQVVGRLFNDVFTDIDLPSNNQSLLYKYDNDQEAKVIQLTFNSLQRVNQGELGMIIVLQDVTKEQNLEQMRQDFVANVSHELRTPLTTIKSYLEALEDGAVDNKQLSKRFLGVISNETERMIRLVHDLLQIAQLDKKEITLNKSLVSVQEMIEDVVERFRFQSSQKSIELITKLPDYLPTVMLARDQIDQVLDNLISNAIKYTKKGGRITVTGKLLSDRLMIEVMDTGIGIPKKHLSRLFERFYRVDKARSRELGGTGLGLSIAREIIKAHHGEIHVDSEIDEGTKISFFIPVSQGDDLNERTD